MPTKMNRRQALTGLGTLLGTASFAATWKFADPLLHRLAGQDDAEWIA